METLGQVIRSRRKKLRLSQEALAELTNLHAHCVGKVERSESIPNIWVLSSLLITLGAQGVGVGPQGWEPLFECAGERDFRSFFQSLRPAQVMADIAGAVHQRRQTQGLSLQEVALTSQVHRNTLWALENSLAVCCSAKLHHIYQALGVRHISLDHQGIRLLG